MCTDMRIFLSPFLTVNDLSLFLKHFSIKYSWYTYLYVTFYNILWIYYFFSTENLRALFLVAIQDDSFESMRDVIVEQPQRKINKLMNNIYEKDSPIYLKDESREFQDGGLSKTLRVTFDRNYKSNNSNQPSNQDK